MNPIPTQRRRCASQHLRQRNTSEQIGQILLIFEEATVLRKLVIEQFKKINNSVNSYALLYGHGLK